MDHLLWEQGAGGSNPLTPTLFFSCQYQTLRVNPGVVLLRATRVPQWLMGKRPTGFSERSRDCLPSAPR